ncbi:hypothetical protein DL96DRAFT_1599628 [Flagelloscypha sp. PMI_526]|nr:hypothetical protein DL96DRAFT_1599628 [Flagelloscypha sp. PMI_526]
MATIDASQVYLLTNNYTGSGRYLASCISTQARWYLTPAQGVFYNLHTVDGGQGYSLDVLNDAGTSSIRLIMTQTAGTSGQLWRFDVWSSFGIPDYRLSNNFTGVDMHLDVYSDTLEPHLANGDHTGQHWLLRSMGSTTPANTPSASGASGGGTTKGGISPGAIAGIVIGSIVALGAVKRAAPSESQMTQSQGPIVQETLTYPTSPSTASTGNSLATWLWISTSHYFLFVSLDL